MRRLARVTVFFAAWFATAAASEAAAQASQDTLTLRFTTRAAEVAVGGRVQTQFSTTSVERAYATAWELRRVRLELQVRANPWVSARLQPEFAGTAVSLRDAFVMFDLSSAAQVFAGQAFRPFGLIPQTSSTRILPIERGARIRGVTPLALDHYNLISSLGYADRDVGLQIRGAPRGAPLGLTYSAGVFNGPLFGLTGGRATAQVSSRLTVAPVANLRLGAGWSHRDFGQPLPDDDAFQMRGGNAWQLDLEYGSFARGLHIMAEAATGAFNPFLTGRERFRAGQLWVAYRTPATGPAALQIEPLFRLSYGRPDARPEDRAAGAAGGLLLTPGINLYAGPLNRIMLNYDLWSPVGSAADAHSFKVQFQMAF